MAQAVHAGTEFCREYPELSNEWMTTSNRVVILACENEDNLLDLADVFCWWGCSTVVFYEPDIGEHTALATTAIHGHESSYPTRPMDVISSLPLYRKGVRI